MERKRQSYFWSMFYECPVSFSYDSQAWIPLKKHDRFTKISKQCLHSHSKLLELFTFGQKAFYCLSSWDIITFPKHGRIPKLQENGFDSYWPRYFFSFANSIRTLTSLPGPGTGSVSKDRQEVKKVKCCLPHDARIKTKTECNSDTLRFFFIIFVYFFIFCEINKCVDTRI